MPRKKENTCERYSRRRCGADEEARTLYLHLGKVALYQMSYIRIFNPYMGLISACKSKARCSAVLPWEDISTYVFLASNSVSIFCAFVKGFFVAFSRKKVYT